MEFIKNPRLLFPTHGYPIGTEYRLLPGGGRQIIIKRMCYSCRCSVGPYNLGHMKDRERPILLFIKYHTEKAVTASDLPKDGETKIITNGNRYALISGFLVEENGVCLPPEDQINTSRLSRFK